MMPQLLNVTKKLVKCPDIYRRDEREGSLAGKAAGPCGTCEATG